MGGGGAEAILITVHEVVLQALCALGGMRPD